MASDTKAAARTIVEKLLKLNSELEGYAHHWSDNLLSGTLLDTLAAHLPDVVHVHNTGKVHQSKWRDDFDQVCLGVISMFEENDRMLEGKNAIDAERRAMRTKTAAVGDDMSSLRNELRQLREQMTAMTTTKSATRTTTSAKLCNNCKVPHRGECYGEAIATSKLTLEQAAETFSLISDPTRRPPPAAAALKRYQDHKARKGGGNAQNLKSSSACAP
eukprot:5780000-Pleurochrysis_carterae.AAC.1